jgi:LPXTG-motif cell wall-anchored protein
MMHHSDEYFFGGLNIVIWLLMGITLFIIVTWFYRFRRRK